MERCLRERAVTSARDAEALRWLQHAGPAWIIVDFRAATTTVEGRSTSRATARSARRRR